MIVQKIEIDIFVDLSSRQRALYRALLANVSVADLLEKAANIGDADSARSLMNLVMQFRKVSDFTSPRTTTGLGNTGLQPSRAFRTRRCHRAFLLRPFWPVRIARSRRRPHFRALLHSKPDRVSGP